MSSSIEEAAEKRVAFPIDVTYNGVTKDLEVHPQEQIQAVLVRAMALFHVTQQPHQMGLFRKDGTEIPVHETVHQAGLRKEEVVVLRQKVVQGGRAA